MRLRIVPPGPLRGRIAVPGDKSISHRAALLGALASGRTEITGFLEGEDCLRTLAAVRALGVEVARKAPGHYLVDGVGITGLREPDDVIDCGNSGTTARLLIGVLAGQPFVTTLTGDASLRQRPMERIAVPLRAMGATVIGRQEGRRLPMVVQGARPLRAIRHDSPVASAQVKTALLLAGLAADGPVTVTEPAASRDHGERMLAGFGADLVREGRSVTIAPGRALTGQLLHVPGDISSAAFFLVAAVTLPEATITVSGVGVNPTRTGILDSLEAMGARIERASTPSAAAEPVADLHASTARLRGAAVGGELMPRLIDEVPALAVAACAASGVTRITDAAELRVKESDRIRAIATQLARLGADVAERSDGLEIRGGRRLHGARVSSGGDHRMAMALVIAGLLAEGETVVDDTECIATSFPGFVQSINDLAGRPCVTVLS